MTAPISIYDAAADVLHRLNVRGVRLDTDDAGGLTFDAPADAMTPGDLAELRRLKQHCLHILETVELFDVSINPNEKNL
jgi:hypothetical protein